MSIGMYERRIERKFEDIARLRQALKLAMENKDLTSYHQDMRKLDAVLEMPFLQLHNTIHQIIEEMA